MVICYSNNRKLKCGISKTTVRVNIFMRINLFFIFIGNVLIMFYIEELAAKSNRA